MCIYISPDLYHSCGHENTYSRRTLNSEATRKTANGYSMECEILKLQPHNQNTSDRSPKQYIKKHLCLNRKDILSFPLIKQILLIAKTQFYRLTAVTTNKLQLINSIPEDFTKI